jgi:hypothetical protein
MNIIKKYADDIGEIINTKEDIYGSYIKGIITAPGQY